MNILKNLDILDTAVVASLGLNDIDINNFYRKQIKILRKRVIEGSYNFQSYENSLIRLLKKRKMELAKNG